MPRLAPALSTLAFAMLAACGGTDAPTDPGTNLAPGTVTPGTPATIAALGRGDFKPARTTGELFVRGSTAYTTTWGNAASAGSVFYIWDVAADIPRLVDSVKVENSQTLGDVVVSDDGALLVVATEKAPGTIVVYSLADPRKPQLVSRFGSPETEPGIHTAEIGRVNGKLYGVLAVDPGPSPARIVIVDLSIPSAPQQVFSQAVGRPFVHDTFVRDGLLFLSLWNDGLAIWDLGGGGKGGTPAKPVEIGRVATVGGEAHNVWWMKDPLSGSARYAFVGEEGPSSSGVSSSGDVHVIDVSNMSAPKEVAYYTVAGAGTHNFSMDEPNGILYAAYYNGGVRALDVRGDLGTCTVAQKGKPAGGNADLCDLRKMGRELGVGLLDRGVSVFVWGVQHLNGSVYASDMSNGLWKMRALSRP